MSIPNPRLNRIFISYRREDNTAVTGRIYDRLCQKFGGQSVFKDIDSIPLGVNFRHHIDGIVQACDVVLVIVGGRWAGETKKTGARRIDNPNDFVRIEIESALQRDIRVIPLLIDGAEMPSEESLPESIKGLADRHGIRISHDPHFHTDMQRLIGDLETYFQSCTPDEPTPLMAVEASADRAQVAKNHRPTEVESLSEGPTHAATKPDLKRPATQERRAWISVLGYVLAGMIGIVFLTYLYTRQGNTGTAAPGRAQLVTQEDLRLALNDAKRSIRASGFLVQAIDSDLVNDRVRRAPDFTAELLMVDPLNSAVVCARQRDEDNYLTYEKIVLKIRIFHKTSADLLGNKLRLAVTNSYPTMTVVMIDDDLYAYFYPYGKAATGSPVLKIQDYETDERAKFFVEHYNKLRNDARELVQDADFQKYDLSPKDLKCPPPVTP